IAHVSTVERAHGNEVHDVPANLCPWFYGFGSAVNDAVHFLLASVPEALPCQNLGILEQQAPERNEGSVRGARAVQGIGYPLIQFHVAFACALGIDPVIAPLAHAVLAEAIDRRPVRRE